ncbi:hypothetical protein [Hymenobacter persicinus]|uniref:Uncharacterized protein n=1 Tax=Hymenobacter persicinus TaxID=2025506 RepID=A0A4Q5LEE9_9BACT|nr:hypothetical protein [Hymenobacter persicinus]RYU80490.1 hypothetical protein EWM57_08330 [Hymenobacter persicinus]
MFGFLKHILSKPGAQEGAQWKPLARTTAQVRAHEQWVAQQVYLNWMGPYFKAYHFRKTGVSGQGLRVQLLDECGRQGALFLFDPSIGPGNFRHLFDFIRDRVISLGYNLSTSDQRTLRHERYTEVIDKHFLKPQPKDCTQSGRCNQLFGTVTVDMVSVNGQPGFIRFSSNPYHDAIFTPAGSFDALMDKVFNLPPAPPEVQALIKQYAK